MTDKFIFLIWFCLVFGIVVGANNAITAMMINFQRARGSCFQHSVQNVCDVQTYPVSGRQQCKWVKQFEVCVFADTCIKRDPAQKGGCGEGCFADDDGDTQSCYPMEGWSAGYVGVFASSAAFGSCLGSSVGNRGSAWVSRYTLLVTGAAVFVVSILWMSVVWEKPSVVNNSNIALLMKLVAARFTSGLGVGIVHFVIARQLFTLSRTSPAFHYMDTWRLLKLLYLFECIGTAAVSVIAVLLRKTTAGIVSEVSSGTTIIAVFFGVALGALAIIFQPFDVFNDDDVRIKLKVHREDTYDGPASEDPQPLHKPRALLPSKYEHSAELDRIFVMLERSLAMCVLVFGGFLASICVRCFWSEVAIIFFLSLSFLGSSLLFIATDWESDMGELAIGVARAVQVAACLAACIAIRSTFGEDPTATGNSFTWFLLLSLLMVASNVTHYGTRCTLHESQSYDLYQQIHLQSFLDGMMCLVMPVVMAHGVSVASYSPLRLEWFFLACGIFTVLAAYVSSREKHHTVHNID